MFKYPRMKHVEGSRLQEDDGTDPNWFPFVPFEEVTCCELRIEEKLDGANVGIGFENGSLFLQSRGHYLEGGPREVPFDMLKRWAAMHYGKLRDVLGDKYLLYCEWLHSKHTVFYDRLPSFLFALDVLDVEASQGKPEAEWTFLSHELRHSIAEELGIPEPPLVHEGFISDVSEISRRACGEISRFRSADWRDSLKTQCEKRSVSFEKELEATDPTRLVEGVVARQEKEGRLVARHKYVRRDFSDLLNKVKEHWSSKRFVNNSLSKEAEFIPSG